MTGQCEGKVALVTGAASGIGRATALAFARGGAKVVLADVAVERCDNTVVKIEEAGGEVYCVETDVSQPDQVEALINKAVKTYSRRKYI
jgi:NAD(P)-dependent dehydrogenase (short-subunit alcohol dehydrogenase family)